MPSNRIKVLITQIHLTAGYRCLFGFAMTTKHALIHALTVYLGKIQTVPPRSDQLRSLLHQGQGHDFELLSLGTHDRTP